LFGVKAGAYNSGEMPKKRRQAHIPQQTTRKRRVVRRPGFESGPEPEERVDLEGNPIFADSVAVPDAMAHYGTTGPVETRPHWIEGTPQQQRQPGRRLAQLRRGAQGEGAARIIAGQLPTFSEGYLSEELRRIAITAGSLFGIIIVLAILMR
jgi:hypothetical protein